MWAINHIIVIQIKGSRIYPNARYTIQRWNTSEFTTQLYQFKYTQARLTIKLIRGLEVCKTHGLINETCKSFYQNLTTLYI